MESKVNLKEEIPEEYTYPYLGISDNGIIVLFISRGEGITVNKSRQYDIGSYAINWAVDDFRLFNGEVTLSND